MTAQIFSDFQFCSVRIIGIGYSDDPQVTHYGPGQRNQMIIHFCLGGCGSFRDHQVACGQGFLIFPGEREEYHSDPQDPWSFLWIIAEGSNAKELGNCFPSNENAVFSFSYVDEMRSLAKRVGQLSAKHRYPSTELFSIVLNILSLQTEQQGGRSRSDKDRYADYAKNYIENNYFRKISVTDITNALYITQPYLFRVFTDKYGISPKQYLTRHRMETACRLLITTDLNISEIARESGYENQLAFTRLFTKYNGCAPTVYRNKHASVNAS